MILKLYFNSAHESGFGESQIEQMQKEMGNKQVIIGHIEKQEELELEEVTEDVQAEKGKVMAKVQAEKEKVTEDMQAEKEKVTEEV